MSAATAPTAKTDAGKLVKASKRLTGGLQGIRLAWQTHSLLGDTAPRQFSAMNPLVERAQLGRAIARLFRSFFSPLSANVKMSKLSKSEAGRMLLVELTKRCASAVLGDEKKGEQISAKLSQQLPGGDFIAGLERAVLEVAGDEKAARKVAALVREHVRQGVYIGEKGVVDAISGIGKKEIHVYTKDGALEVVKIGERRDKYTGIEPEEYLKALRYVREVAGVNLKKSYAELVLGEIIVKSLEEANSAKEARELFLSKLQAELESDKLFAQGFQEVAWKELSRQYAAGASVGALFEALTTLPARLVSLASRMLASAYRVLPLVGAVAAVNAEAAGAIAELGEGLRSRVEQSAYTWHSLSGLGLGDIQRYVHSQRISQQQAADPTKGASTATNG